MRVQEAQLEAKVALLKSASLEEAQRQEELEQQLSNVQTDLNTCRAELQAAQQQLGTAQTHEEALEQSTTALQEVVDRRTAELHAFQELLTAAQADKEAGIQQAAALQTELNGCKADLQVAREQLAAAGALRDEQARLLKTAVLQKVCSGDKALKKPVLIELCIQRI